MNSMVFLGLSNKTKDFTLYKTNTQLSSDVMYEAFCLYYQLI